MIPNKMQKTRRDLGVILAALGLYIGGALLAIRSTINIDGPTAVALELYTKIGLEIDLHIARAIALSLFSSCVTHVFLIIHHSARYGWPEIKEGETRTVGCCFTRAVLAIFFCILVAGALGDNISSRTSPMINKEFSILVGGLVLGGVVWLINDFAGALHNKLIRKFK